MALMKLYSNRSKQPKLAATKEDERKQIVKKQVVINSPVGVLNLGPTYNINVGQAFTEVNANTVTKTKKYKTTKEVLDKAVPTKEFMNNLLSSKRQIDYPDILKLSKNIGKNWKIVGGRGREGLKFSDALLDQFESDTKCHSDAVRRMLYRWWQWKDEKATVDKLARALFNAKEFDALKYLQ